MTASDMLLLLNYWMEQDTMRSGDGEAEALSNLRTIMYREVFGVEYPHVWRVSSKKSGQHASTGTNPYGTDMPVDPTMRSKGYMKATKQTNDDANPFGDIVGAPL